MRATRSARARIAASLIALACLGGDCGGGDGSGGGAPRIEITNRAADCLTVSGSFPSGFDLLPDSRGAENGNGVVVQFVPPAVLGVDLSASPPRLLATSPVPSLFPNGDSDGDGVSDALASQAAGFALRSPLAGTVLAVSEDLVLVSTTNYEQLIFADPSTGELVEVEVATPPGFAPGIYPFLPPPGTSAMRTAISTRVCVEPPQTTDSAGRPLGTSNPCPPPASGTSFDTRLTAGAAVAAQHLFVATSNLLSSAQSRFAPGTVLVYELDTSATPPFVRPSPLAPVLFTTGFNPTQVTAYTTPSGRELLLVTVTGAIGAGSGSSNIASEGAVDVIDAIRQHVVATVPLGPAGPSFDEIAVEPAGRVALLGASSERALFAIDLAPLDDPAIYLNPGAPIALDGSVPGFADARIHAASNPLFLPDRVDGPDATMCAGLTHVAAGGVLQRAYATDFCDGTVTTLLIDALGAPVPFPADRIQILGSEPFFAPNVPASLTQLRAPGAVRIKDGEPGVDFPGPDGFVLAGLPEGALCAFDFSH